MSLSPDDDAFFAGRRTAAVPFAVNDTVLVADGPCAGRSGAIVLLDRSRHPFRFLVEFGDGTDELAEARHLCRVDAAD